MNISKLKEMLDRPGYSQAELARALGRNPAAITRMLQGKRAIKADELPIIARYLNEPVAVLDEMPPLRPRIVEAVPLERGARDLPVFGCYAGKDGVLHFDPVPIGAVERPPFLRYSRAAFGIYCINTFMSPAFEPKDMLVINPDRTPSIGDDAIFVTGYNADELVPFQGVLRRLVGETETHWRVRQFNPQKDHNIPKAELPRALLVAGKYSR